MRKPHEVWEEHLKEKKVSILEDAKNVKNGKKKCDDCKHSRYNNSTGYTCPKRPCTISGGAQAFEPVEKKVQHTQTCPRCEASVDQVEICSGMCSDCFISDNKATEIIKFMLEYLPEIRKINIHGDRTVLYFKSGGKTMVKKSDGEDYDLEKAVLYGFIKHMKKKYSILRGGIVGPVCLSHDLIM